MIPTLAVGQKLWFIPSDERYNGREVTVVRIGRKWAYIGPKMRIDLSTLWADGRGYMSPGQCWITRTGWEVEMERRAKWMELKQTIDRTCGPPEHLTTNEIVAALAMVKGPPT